MIYLRVIARSCPSAIVLAPGRSFRPVRCTELIAMDSHNGRAAVMAGFLHRHFLWLFLRADPLSGLPPNLGQWISGLAGTSHVLGHGVRASAPAVMLGVLLFAAGLAVKGVHLRGVFRRPAALAAGLAASILVPVLVLIVAAPLLSLWPDAAEAR